MLPHQVLRHKQHQHLLLKQSSSPSSPEIKRNHHKRRPASIVILNDSNDNGGSSSGFLNIFSSMRRASSTHSLKPQQQERREFPHFPSRRHSSTMMLPAGSGSVLRSDHVFTTLREASRRGSVAKINGSSCKKLSESSSCDVAVATNCNPQG